MNENKKPETPNLEDILTSKSYVTPINPFVIKEKKRKGGSDYNSDDHSSAINDLLADSDDLTELDLDNEQDEDLYEDINTLIDDDSDDDNYF